MSSSSPQRSNVVVAPTTPLGATAATLRPVKYDNVFKLIVVGDTNCGKSCILHQFVEGKFRSGPAKHTVGVEFGSRVVLINGKMIKLQIWDTAGQERFRSVTHSYYRGALGALIVYDVASRESFAHLATWIADVRALAGPTVSVCVAGNKSDLPAEQRAVSLLEGSRFALENDAMFLETSALDGSNVEEVFYKIAKTIRSKIDSDVIDPNSPLVHGGTLPNNLRQGPAAIQLAKQRELDAKAAASADAAGCAC